MVFFIIKILGLCNDVYTATIFSRDENILNKEIERIFVENQKVFSNVEFVCSKFKKVIFDEIKAHLKCIFTFKEQFEHKIMGKLVYFIQLKRNLHVLFKTVAEYRLITNPKSSLNEVVQNIIEENYKLIKIFENYKCLLYNTINKIKNDVSEKYYEIEIRHNYFYGCLKGYFLRWNCELRFILEN